MLFFIIMIFYSCIDVNVSFYLFIFKFWDCEQNSVPNVWEVVFPNISIKGGVVHPNLHSLLDGPGQAVFLPTYNVHISKSLEF